MLEATINYNKNYESKKNTNNVVDITKHIGLSDIIKAAEYNKKEQFLYIQTLKKQNMDKIRSINNSNMPYDDFINFNIELSMLVEKYYEDSNFAFDAAVINRKNSFKLLNAGFLVSDMSKDEIVNKCDASIPIGLSLGTGLSIIMAALEVAYNNFFTWFLLFFFIDIILFIWSKITGKNKQTILSKGIEYLLFYIFCIAGIFLGLFVQQTYTQGPIELFLYNSFMNVPLGFFICRRLYTIYKDVRGKTTVFDKPLSTLTKALRNLADKIDEDK